MFNEDKIIGDLGKERKSCSKSLVFNEEKSIRFFADFVRTLPVRCNGSIHNKLLLPKYNTTPFDEN
jgi:hypothetical protein